MNKRRIHPFTLVLLSLLLLSGCTALELRDANSQLSALYGAKLDILKATAQAPAQAPRKEHGYAMLESTYLALGQLAQDAAAQAQKSSDPLNKIAFYRIATTAAWQAEDSRVVEYGTAGEAVCERTGAGKAPRDCGMLSVIPTLASVDEQTELMNSLQKAVNEADWRSNDTDRQAAERIYTSLRDAFNRLAGLRPGLRDSGVHPTFIKGLDANIGILLCEQLDSSAIGLLGIVGSSRLDEAGQSIDGMKCMLMKQGMDPASAACLEGVDSQSCL